MNITRTCEINKCDRPHKGRGWCSMHYQGWLKYGDPEAGGRKFTNPEDAFTARTERQGDCLIWTGGVNEKGYGRMVAHGERMAAHRYAWSRAHGDIPAGMVIDHSCYNKSCVNVAHLRLATLSQNASNLAGARRSSALGIRNVTPEGRKYRVFVQRHGEQHNGGLYESLDDAISAAEELRGKLFGAYAGLPHKGQGGSADER